MTIGSRPLSSSPLGSAARGSAGASAALITGSQTLEDVAQSAPLLAVVAAPGRLAGVFSTWNPADMNGTTVLTGGDLIASGGTNSAVRGTKAHYPLNSTAQGIRQFEVAVGNRGSTDSLYIGVGTATDTLAAPGTASGTSVGYRANGAVWKSGSVEQLVDSWADGDVVGVMVDSRLLVGGISFFKNGVPLATLALIDAPLFPMVGAVGASGWQLTLATSSLQYPATGAQAWGAGTPFVENILDGVAQSATGTTGGAAVDRSFAGSQSLADVAQAATATVPASLIGSQTLAAVTQSAAAAALVKSAASQTLAGVTQAATGSVPTATGSFSAAQTLDAVARVATAAVIAKAAAVQTLGGVGQSTAVSSSVRAAGTQSLAAAVGAATAIAVASAQAAQTLAAVSQAATATAGDTVRFFVAAQVLASVVQVARVRPAYVFERNERTVRVVAEDRGIKPIPESRRVAILGERRAAAFTN